MFLFKGNLYDHVKILVVRGTFCNFGVHGACLKIVKPDHYVLCLLQLVKVEENYYKTTKE